MDADEIVGRLYGGGYYALVRFSDLNDDTKDLIAKGETFNAQHQELVHQLRTDLESALDAKAHLEAILKETMEVRNELAKQRDEATRLLRRHHDASIIASLGEPFEEMTGLDRETDDFLKRIDKEESK